MKRNIIFAATLIILSTLASCTQNEGYIGDLFGIWRLEEITDGTTVEECDTIFMAFQADVFQVRRGAFTIYGDTPISEPPNRTEQPIQCKFFHNTRPEARARRAPPPTTHDLASLHIGEISPVFVVEELNKRNMKLEYNGYRYIFVKL